MVAGRLWSVHGSVMLLKRSSDKSGFAGVNSMLSFRSTGVSSRHFVPVGASEVRFLVGACSGKLRDSQSGRIPNRDIVQLNI